MPHIHLGNIYNSFTIENIDTVLVLDADCSDNLNSGETISVKTKAGKEFSAPVKDCLLEQGAVHGVSAETISAIRVTFNENIPQEELLGGVVTKQISE